MNTLTFREKSILGTLVATVVVAIGYFSYVTPMLLRQEPLLAFLWPAVAAIVANIVIHIVYHSLLASTDVEVPADERDRLVDLNATRFAYYTLCTGCVLFLGIIVVFEVFAFSMTQALVLHALSLALTLADVGKYVSQLVGYRCLA